MEHINTLKVMIVDDEFPIRKWFSRAMKNLPDMKVDFSGAASNGEEACGFSARKAGCGLY